MLEAMDDPQDTPPGWLEEIVKTLDDSNLDSYWSKIGTHSPVGAVPAPFRLDSNYSHFLAGAEGIPPGSPLGMGGATVHAYAIYGKCENEGVVTIKVGYRKAF